MIDYSDLAEFLGKFDARNGCRLKTADEMADVLMWSILLTHYPNETDFPQAEETRREVIKHYHWYVRSFKECVDD